MPKTLAPKKGNFNFASLAAHELKTPLSVLKLLTQMQMAKFQKYGSCVTRMDEFELMQIELNRITSLVNNLLDLSNLEKGRLKLNFRLINLTSLIGEAINAIGYKSGNHKIIFYNEHYLICTSKGQNICSHKLEAPKINVVADPDKLRQVLINLLINAIKYSPPKTQIKVLTRKDKSSVTVSVQDFGQGIPRGKLSVIFSKFYRVGSTKIEGLGLGLFISKKIIEAHKGKIWVNSKVGKGSCFEFSLPTKTVAQTTE